MRVATLNLITTGTWKKFHFIPSSRLHYEYHIILTLTDHFYHITRNFSSPPVSSCCFTLLTPSQQQTTSLLWPSGLQWVPAVNSPTQQRCILDHWHGCIIWGWAGLLNIYLNSSCNGWYLNPWRTEFIDLPNTHTNVSISCHFSELRCAGSWNPSLWNTVSVYHVWSIPWLLMTWRRKVHHGISYISKMISLFILKRTLFLLKPRLKW